MALRSKLQGGFRLLPARDAWLAALPFLPLVALGAALTHLVDPAQQLAFLAYDESVYRPQPARSFVHLGDMLTYYALAGVHVCICLGAAGWFFSRMTRLPAAQRTRAFRFLRTALLILVPLVLFYVIFADDSVIVQLGFKATCVALETARLPTALSGAGCFAPGGISTLTLLAWIPTFSGMGAALFAAACADGSVTNLPSRTEPNWQAALDGRIRTLERSVYVLSAVLVSSTITITLFARLPLGLFPDGSALAGAMSAYVVGLSTFWGGLFTLTLLATFAGPAWQLLRHAEGKGAWRTADAGVEAAPDLGAWLQEHVFVTVKRQFGNIVSLLAPLLVGPLSSLLSSLTGG